MNYYVFQTLSGAAAVTAIVGTNPVRVYEDTAPQNVTRPYITWSTVGGTPENQLSGTPGIDRGRIQIDCWAADKATCRNLAVAVRNAMESICHMVSVPMSDYEQETKLFRYLLEFEVFQPR